MMFYPRNSDARTTQVMLTGEIKPFGARELNIRYDYSSIIVGTESEEDYLSKTVKELNEKVPGKGDKFKEEWFAARKAKYEPKFEEILNRWGPRVGISGTNYTTTSPVTIVVKTFGIDVTKRRYYITVQIIFLDINDQQMFVYTVEDAPGGDLRACYGSAAHFFMKRFTKELKKLEKQKK